MQILVRLAKGLALGIFFKAAAAAPVMINDGGSVTVQDRYATFDTLTAFRSADLALYSEDAVYVRTPSSYPSFNMCSVKDPCWYPNAGYEEYPTAEQNLVMVGATDHVSIYAVEFKIDSGLAYDEEEVFWQTLKSGVITGAGRVRWAGAGSTVGWKDTQGFDELRVGLYDPLGRPIFGGAAANLISIDNLRVQITPVPEPEVFMMLSMGLLVVASRHRKIRGTHAGAV